MSALARKIRRKILRDGPMPFAQFMEWALYVSKLGYYEQPGRVGRGGDFFTSVSTGPLFGRLLAFQFAEWLEADFPNGKFQLVEAGAHDGRLAADILEWLESFRPDLITRLEYCIVEPSPRRRAWQEQTLGRLESNIRWKDDIRDFSEGGINGIVFSNEFFDALPVHRLAWDATNSRWREWCVIVDDDEFAWELNDPAKELERRLPSVPVELARVLPDGFVAELSPAASDWWRTAARALRRGKLLTLDYGFNAKGGLRPDRPMGSLRAFHGHRASANLLDRPGEQDITASVDFSALEEAGTSAGLGAGILMRQSKFLTQSVAKIHANPGSFGPWDQKSARQFQTLAHPEHLGHPFQVLIQF